MCQFGAQHGAATVNARAHRAEFDVQDAGYFVVRQALEVAQHYCRAELSRQFVECLLHVEIEVHLFESTLWAWIGGRNALFTAVNEGIKSNALLAAGLIQEKIGGDAVQPSTKRSRLIRMERAEDSEEGLLSEIFGILAVARQSERKSVDLGRIFCNDFLPAGNVRCICGGRVLGGNGGFHAVNYSVQLCKDSVRELDKLAINL